MPNSLGTHTFSSAFQRLRGLIRHMGAWQTLAFVLGSIDDNYLKSFDRRYRVKTSGFIRLDNTLFDRARLSDATQYGPTNAWAVRRVLEQLSLPKELHFVDLGCGMGRVCILAAEYGFAQVTGVDLAPEFCAIARDNAQNCRAPKRRLSPITILEMDALAFCDQTDADVFFMFRPFSADFLKRILKTLRTCSGQKNKTLTIIYTERASVAGSYANLIAAHPGFHKQRESLFWGQEFHIFECRGNASGIAA